MPNRPSTVLVRIPVDLKERLEKVKEEKELKSLGEALEYWLKQATNENIERKFSKINERIERKFSAIEKWQGEIMNTVGKIAVLQSRHFVEEAMREIEKKYGSPPDFKKLLQDREEKLAPIDGYMIETVRIAKRTLEAIDYPSPHHEMASVILYLLGDREEDRSPKQEEIFNEWLQKGEAEKPEEGR